MFIRFVKKFSKYSAVSIGYCLAYGLLSYTLGLIAPWLFPVLTLVGFVGFFAYHGAKDQAAREQHEADKLEAESDNALLLDQLRKCNRA